MSRRTLVIVSLELLLVACILVVAVVAVQRFLERDEQRASRQSRDPTPIAVPGGTVPAIGSGSCSAGGWYTLCFTGPVYPDDKARHTGGLDSQLVALMDRAQRSIDVADYDFDLLIVADAMARAKQRGVTVRMLTDSDTVSNDDPAIQAAFSRLRAASVPIVEDQRNAIMHSKFTVVDGTWVQTGSWNYTDGDTYRLNNNMIIIQNPQVAQNYANEFEKMFSQKRFGPNKARGVPNPVVTIDGSRIETYFAPQDGVSAKIVDRIRQARSSVRFLAFSFTHDGIAQAMRERAAAGVSVEGVFETTGSQTQYAEFGPLQRAGIPVYTDGNPWVMHHKVIIIDEATVIFGSYNFSESADRENDENVLIVTDPAIAKAFTAEYDRVLALAKDPPVRKR